MDCEVFPLDAGGVQNVWSAEDLKEAISLGMNVENECRLFDHGVGPVEIGYNALIKCSFHDDDDKKDHDRLEVVMETTW